MLSTQAWYTFVSVLTLIARRIIAFAALPIRVFSSMSRERLLEMVEVFLRLMVRLDSLHACAKRLMSRCRASSVCAVRAVSSDQHLPDQYFTDFSLCSESCKVEEVPVASGVEVYAII